MSRDRIIFISNMCNQHRKWIIQCLRIFILKWFSDIRSYKPNSIANLYMSISPHLMSKCSMLTTGLFVSLCIRHHKRNKGIQRQWIDYYAKILLRADAIVPLDSFFKSAVRWVFQCKIQTTWSIEWFSECFLIHLYIGSTNWTQWAVRKSWDMKL